MLKIFFTFCTCYLLESVISIPLPLDRGPVDESNFSDISNSAPTLFLPNLQAPNYPEQNAREQSHRDQEFHEQTLQELKLRNQNLQVHNYPEHNVPEQSLRDQEFREQALQELKLQDQNLQALNYPEQNLQKLKLQDQNLQAPNYPEQNAPEESLRDQEFHEQTHQELKLQAPNYPEQNLPEQNLRDPEFRERTLLELKPQEQNLHDHNVQETLEGVEERVPYLVVGEAGREKRDIELEDLGLEGVTFEVPPLLRVNGTRLNENGLDSAPGLERASVGANMRNSEEPQQVDIVNMPVNSCSPAPKKPVSLTILLENIIPSGKSERYICSNTSQIRGSGAVLKVNFCDTKTTPSNGKDPCEMLMRSNDFMDRDRKFDKIESKSRKSMSGEVKTDEEEEDEDELTDKTSIEDVLRKILLAGNMSSSSASTLREDFANYPESAEPLAFVMKPSLIQKLSAKKSTTIRTVRSNNKNPNPEQLYKLLEQLSSHLPKAKLVSLLSTLVTRISNDQVHG